MNMYNWLDDIKKMDKKKAMPVLSFPGIQIINTSVDKLVYNAELQSQCMKAIADRYDTLAAVSLMDLSVEAEAFGSPIRLSNDEVPTVTSAIVDTMEDADNLKIPAVGEKRTGEYIRTLELAVQEITDRPVFAGVIGPFSLAGRIMDMTEIMVKCFTDPDIVHAVLEKATAFLINYLNGYKTVKANGVVLAEPAAGLLSPDLIAEFSSPYVKRIIEAVETEEFLFIYHNCGNAIPLINAILSTNARAYHFGNAIKMSEVLPLIPIDKVVMGNIDPSSQFRNGTPESMRKVTLDVMNECSGYKNFVISSGCDIPPMSPLENIDAYFMAVEEFNCK